ncbi:MAG: CapA family protein [Candidatus Hodarchaeota archaeon]
MKEKVKLEDKFDWARDIQRKRFSTPYNFKENMSWLKNNVLGPSKKFKELTRFIPQEMTLNAITPELTLGFIGDIMKMKGETLGISNELKEFIKPVDYLIGNFEGTIINEKIGLMTQVHDEKILNDLKHLFAPERFVLSCANNHSGDFVWSEFNKSYQKLKDHGFLVIGRKDKPSILLDNQVNVLSCTDWSNQPNTGFILYLDAIDEFHDPSARFNILYPHWGYEMQLYPKPAQIEIGKKLLEKWDAIIGHHSHCPQPVTSYSINKINKLLAYSLGNFCFEPDYKMYYHGIIIKVQVGPDDGGNWQMGKVEWKFTRLHKDSEKNIEIKLDDKCRFFPELDESITNL